MANTDLHCPHLLDGVGLLHQNAGCGQRIQLFVPIRKRQPDVNDALSLLVTVREEPHPVNDSDPAKGGHVVGVVGGEEPADGRVEGRPMGLEVQVKLGGRLVHVSKKRSEKGHLGLVCDAQALQKECVLLRFLRSRGWHTACPYPKSTRSTKHQCTGST